MSLTRLLEAARRLLESVRRDSGRGSAVADVVAVLRVEARFALRRLRKAPAFTAAAVVTLALGVGVNTAVFGVVQAALLRPLPYHDPGQLVHLAYHGRRVRIPFTPGEFQSLSAGVRSAQAVGAFRWQNEAVLSSGTDSWLLTTAGVSGNLFDLLGATAALGRPVLPSDAVPGAAPVVVISHRVWESVFGADPNVLGRTYSLDEGRYARGSYEIVGVMPAGFWFPDRTVDLWVPIPTDASTLDARSENIQLLARVKDGVAPGSVADEAADRLRVRSSAEGQGDGPRIVATHFRDMLVGDQALALRVLAGVASLVLLIAAVNLAGLMLAREQRQLRALRVRLALGASLGRLMTARVLDGAYVAILGALVGIGLASAALPLLASRLPPEISRVGEVLVDGPVLSFGLAVAVCGIALAVLTPLTPPGSMTGAVGGGLHRAVGIGTMGSGRLRRSLVITQIALSIPLTAASAVLLRSLLRLEQVSPGIRAEHVWTFRLDARHPSMSALHTYFESVLEAIRASAAVRSASIVRDLSFTGASRTNVSMPGRGPDHEDVLVDYQVIHSGFFATLRIPMLAGRDFAASDGADAPRVAIVNQRFVDAHFEGRSPVGQTITLADEPTRIVGVSSDIRRRGLRERPRPEIYVPYAQIFNARGTRILLVLTRDGVSTSPEALIARARRVDPSVAISGARELADVLDASLAREKGLANLLSIFAALSLTLAVAGLAGLLAFMVGSREPELAVRTALGADPASLSRLVLRETVLLCSVGLLFGIPAALGLTRLLRSFLFEVSTLDPIAFTGAAAALLGGAAAATWLPARRAMSTDPATAMSGRGER